MQIKNDLLARKQLLLGKMQSVLYVKNLYNHLTYKQFAEMN